MKIIDNDSLEFIAFAKELMDDKEFYNNFLLEGKRKFEKFISRDSEEIKSLLNAKLVRGSIEHGSPGKYTQEEVQKELDMEFLDIIGWSLVGLYCEKKQHERDDKKSTPTK